MYVTKTALIAHCIFIIVTAMISMIFDIPLTWKEVGILASVIGFTTMFFTDKAVNKEKNEVIIYASAERSESIPIDVSAIKSVKISNSEDGTKWKLDIDFYKKTDTLCILMKDQEEANHYFKLIERAKKD